MSKKFPVINLKKNIDKKLSYGILIFIAVVVAGATIFYLNRIPMPFISSKEIVPLPPFSEHQKSYVVVARQDSSFYELAQYFAEKKKADLLGYRDSIDEIISKISLISPTYLALVLSPEDITPDFLDHIDEKLRELDEDQFLDVAYGIITAFDVGEGYKYVDRLISFSSLTKINIYGINARVQDINMLNEQGIDTVSKCTFTIEGGTVWCAEKDKTNVNNLAEEVKGKDVFIFNLHGEPTAIYLDDGETIEGTLDGLVGVDKNGNHIPINFNAALVIAHSCMTTRVNGRPSKLIEEGWDDPRSGVVERSVALSFLKSGALNYVGASHYANLVLTPDRTLVPQSMIEGKPIGIAIKNLKNWYIYNVLIKKDDREAAPRADERTLKFLEYQLKNWVLFGDPSLALSIKKGKVNACIREYSESLSTKEVDGKPYLLKNVHLKLKFIDNDGDLLENTPLYSQISEQGEYSASGCAINIPLESKLVKYSIDTQNIEPRYQEYFGGSENIVLSAGDELISIIPEYVGQGDPQREAIEFDFTIQMESEILK